MRTLYSIIMSAMLMSSAQGAQTEWIEIAPDTRARMIFSDILDPGGTTMIALELDMPPTSKTYWRVPGETGIPLIVDASASQKLTAPRVIWPFPQSETSYGFTDRVFHGYFILPMQVSVLGENPYLDYNLIMGVCSDICVPVSINFSHNLSFEERDSASAILIAQAMANTPIRWDKTDLPFGEIVFDQTAQQLHVTLQNSAIDTQGIIVTFGQSNEVFSPPQKSQSDDTLVFSRLGQSNDMEWLQQNVTLTFMSIDGPYELSLPVTIR